MSVDAVGPDTDAAWQCVPEQQRESIVQLEYWILGYNHEKKIADLFLYLDVMLYAE
ncbi:hypothetical protein MMC10_004465 [Thelotrema lepadinum]|nr:hypothetical protein [Thelotrema lepadinum]